MPKIVDHDERRRELLSAARRVIVRDGIDAATTRAIAKEAGYSNGVLAHYFADKDEILLSALRQSHQRIRERITRRVEGVTGLAALREVLLDNLPLDAERTQETRLEVSFWSRSLAAERLAEVQRAEAEELRAAVRGLLAQAREAGELTTEDNLDDVTEHLLALMDGLSLHLLLYPGRLTRVDLERLMLAHLDRL
ncbi:TetR family transcriptional regulator C-terminal domain-containing protein [Nonomuraea sp. SMC257]|uniref:TetR family transcriptional regulator C-terminal domain-containing protein n=1 Tax=Nonomuraea montanisoli TaxID=2741721 RepID=A0A7Y6IDT7_9ACTN|nr:TetR/AcrR family transcriptional regulator [Nonomuraea montanisoli]NUW36432.1 TetR family transcriptional regulator C-terminal domain-containing protein [Nonomuraea montanisoli]